MPKVLPEIAMIKAKVLTKSLMAHNGNVAALAKSERVSKQAIYSKLKRLPEDLTFNRVMDKMGVSDRYLARKLKDGLEAKRFTKQGIKPDMGVRHRYLVTALQCKKYLGVEASQNNLNFSSITFNFATEPDRLLNETERKVIEDMATPHEGSNGE